MSLDPLGRHDNALRLFKTSWVNPHPAEEIVSIDFSSNMKSAAPFLVALTVE
jgi:hypothetical protein